jgi:hypothetical protein
MPGPEKRGAIQKRRSAMKTYFLRGNRLVVCESQGRALRLTKDADAFKTEHELAKLAAEWSAVRFHEIWNALPNTQPVRKFADRKTAVRRIWNQAQKLKPVPSPRRTRRRTKADQMLDLLNQTSGATLKSIMAATGWQAHSIRGFISGHLVKKMGLRVRSFRRDGDRVYTIRKLG